MTKLMSIIVGGALGLTLAASVGVGVAVGSNNEFKEAKAADKEARNNSLGGEVIAYVW